jgi:mRNA-degrading endonuclease toxin of MazEF toxin-antitoxin module
VNGIRPVVVLSEVGVNGIRPVVVLSEVGSNNIILKEIL